MVKRNPHFAKLQGGYLFPEINRHKQELLKRKPEADLISLGIGDTTEPIPPHILQGLVQGASQLGTPSGYSGYGPEQGQLILRKKIAEVLYHGKRSADEIFISDGSKCDIGRLQQLFGADCTIAVQDPSYPVYVDTAVAIGQTDHFHQGAYKGITYMPCLPENNFFPDLETLPRTDLIYFCSPNNPTGAVATKEQLTRLVAFAKKNRSILIFDAAYASYIREHKLPKSIYEIEGAEKVAIELNSFSKMAGFTGVRLAYSVVPHELQFEDGTPVRQDWLRLMTTFFNGASNIAQAGALAALDPEGLQEINAQTDYYLENARLIGSHFRAEGYQVYGGTNAPYVWIKFPGRKSWDVFQELLEECAIVSTPGSGFGPAGEGFLRFSAFGNRKRIEQAIDRLIKTTC
jgi:LL-diaminopimelate aminotransferase